MESLTENMFKGGKMNKCLVIATCILMTGIAYAASQENSLAEVLVSDMQAPPPGGPGQLPPDHPCVKVNLTDAQKDQIKELIYQFAQAQVQNEANIKKAFLTTDHTFASATSVKADGQAAQAVVLSALTAGAQGKAALDLSVNYDVLQPGQRENAQLCMHFIRSQHGSHPGAPGSGPGPGPQP
jgi:Spy/CpxP family protein refolding chaperone